MRRMVIRTAALLSAAFAGALLPVATPFGRAAAASDVTVTMVANPYPNYAPGGLWNVNASATATNLTGQEWSVATAAPSEMTWTEPNGSSGSSPGGTGDVVNWPGTANGYATIPPGSSITSFVGGGGEIAADATTADLIVTFQVYPGTYPNLGAPETIVVDAPFIQNGATVPVGLGVAGPLAAAGLGAFLLIGQVGRQRRRTPPWSSGRANG